MFKANITAGVLAALFFGTSAKAADYFDRVSTPAGELVLEKNPSKLTIGDQEFDVSEFGRLHLALSPEDREALAAILPNTHLLIGSTGGLACPHQLIWVNANGEKAKITSPFGDCNHETYMGFEIVGNKVLLDGGGNGFEGSVVYSYDGNNLERHIEGVQAAKEFNPYNPMNWLGKSAQNYLKTAEIEAILLKHMSLDELNKMTYMVSKTLQSTRADGSVMSDDFTEDEGWLIASGCATLMCATRFGIVAINIETGIPYLAMKDGDEAMEFYGDHGGIMPSAMRREIDRRGGM